MVNFYLQLLQSAVIKCALKRQLIEFITLSVLYRQGNLNNNWLYCWKNI